ncbi:tryptophan synthase subunit alpha [Diaphorobacter sp. HDW4B]|uniref:tryptophan synthase subunit alpha n=1 Tax=Diaphorobacter sp. HDW4B TaxID=2714925 RepID=UPI00140B7AC4|nr:tryptophan synthase subunit alpha [Diaphorobacter sp. HDW4B]QIL69143.1 tryptophan synthase subunit alpha [Diaphorobacter sp. HDW4B]
MTAGPATHRLAITFERLCERGRKALITHVVAGYPYADIAPALMHVLVEAGADVIELGVPFSDPSADDPAVQAAGEHALRSGVGPLQVLDQVRQFREADGATPVVLRAYTNPIERYDQLRQSGAFAEDAASAGVDGVLVVDCPLEAPGELAAQLRHCGLDMILRLASSSTERHVRVVAERASGYLCCLCVKALTGDQTLDRSLVEETLARIRRHVRIPVGINFSIRDAHATRDIAQSADAVVIDAWLIESLAEKSAAEALAAASDLIRSIRGQLDMDMRELSPATQPQRNRR